jgi:Urocanate hydratase
MLEFHRRGIPTLDYGNNIRQMALEMGVTTPSISPASSPPISVRCSAAASALPLGRPFGDPEDIYRTTSG